MENFRSGFVSIIGKPNVGKSTLLNRLIGFKLGIVSPKPQTTRVNVKGFLNDKNKQIIFLDTPGFLEPRYELHNQMLRYIKTALIDVDIVIFITDLKTYPTEYDRKVLERINMIDNISKIAVLNKTDLVNNNVIEKAIADLQDSDFDNIIPISAKKNYNIEKLLDVLTSFLPFTPPFYSQEELSDLPLRFFAKEVILEQIFLKFKQEIPYSTAVVVEEFKDKGNKVEIRANIWVNSRSQKPILLGKKGSKIKGVRLESQKELYKLTGKRAKLDLWVKVKPGWRKKKNAIKEFGYK